MTEDSLIFDQKFWKVLKYIDTLSSPSPLILALQEAEVDRDQFQNTIHFLSRFNYKVEIKRIDGVEVVIPAAVNNRVHFDLSFAEWLAFQTNFPKLESEDEMDPPRQFVLEKLREVEKNYPEFDLSCVIENERRKQEFLKDLKQSEYGPDILALEQALTNKEVVSISLKEGQFFDFFPHRLVYLDGALSIVGEECNDRCLVYFKVDDVKKVSPEDLSYKPNFCSVEVNDFIFAIRSVTGKEERLVLKITSAEDIDLKPPYHFLGNPYITSSIEGDLIWAASVEVSDELFEWLYSIKHHIEILDPSSLEEEYYQYCEYMNKKAA